MRNIKNFLLTIFIAQLSFFSFGQFSDYNFGKGLQYTSKDSTSGITASFRFQNLIEGNWKVRNDDFNNIGDFSSNFLIRRARLKFDGFAYSEKLIYKVELGLANHDSDHSGVQYSGEGGNVVLDASINWNFYESFSLRVGQYKIPGNRERLISSADMQFVNRSLLNSLFTLDRDIGASLHYDKTLGKQFGLHLTASLAQGDGRNMISGNRGGYQTTFRAEIMPFGEFQKEGAYVGGDIYREQQPKLAFAVAFDKNGRAARSRGNRGEFLPLDAEFKDLYTGFIDFMFKYKGWSAMGEYAIRRTADNDRTITDADGNYVASYEFGTAINLQAGYLFKNNYELSARYTQAASFTTFSSAFDQVHYTLGVSRYIQQHNFKVQTDLGYMRQPFIDDGLFWRVQFEVGF